MEEIFCQEGVENGLSYIPEDRQGLATCRGLDLLDNFLLTTRDGFKKGPWLMRQEARGKAEALLHEFDIRPPNLNAFAWCALGAAVIAGLFALPAWNVWTSRG